MTSTAVFSIDDLKHINLICPGLHLKANVTMTGLAAVANSMKPMRKDDGSNSRVIRIVIDDDIAIFGITVRAISYNHKKH